MATADEVIASFGLEPHPEGGFYHRTYATESCSAIYFLLRPKDVSHLHRLRSDEMWHFYSGDPIVVHTLDADGVHDTIVGNRDGHTPQFLVPGGTWFGSSVAPGATVGYSLVGCTVSPPFSFNQFELATRATIEAEFPAHAAAVAHLCLDSGAPGNEPTSGGETEA